MPELFADARITELAAQIDSQLHELQATGGEALTRGKGGKSKDLAKQRKAIAEATGEAPDSFIQRFVRNARKDLCEQGGLLYEQWKELKDLGSKAMIKTFGQILAGMGLAALPLQTVVVALSVYVLHIGVETICNA